VKNNRTMKKGVNSMSDELHYYPVKLFWRGEKMGEVFVEGKASIKTGTPKDSASSSFHSPEDLFVASAAVCYMNGFVEFVRKMRIQFKSFECEAIGKLEKVDRSFEITHIDITAKIGIDSEDLRNKIDRALELAAKYCFVGNSMKCPITHNTRVVVE
jgi:organic hydroperoxide reductase OsmC/OhrA